MKHNTKVHRSFSTHLALVLGLLSWVDGDWSILEVTVDRLDEGVCDFLFGCGVSQSFQSSSSSTSSWLEFADPFCPFWVLLVATAVACLGLSFCPGVSTPNSLQNDTSVPVGGDGEEELLLPVFLDADASLDSDVDELVRPIEFPC